MSRDSCILDVHPSTVQVHLEKASLVLEFLAMLAEKRGDAGGQDAWVVANQALDHARTKFIEARAIQSNRRDATGGGTVPFNGGEKVLRVALKWITERYVPKDTAAYKRVFEILEDEG